MPRKTALITGASSGIGQFIAEEFARNGIDVVMTARSLDTLRTLAADWSQKYGIQAKTYALDLAVPENAGRLADAVAADGIGIDYLVNSAGFGSFGFFQDADLDGQVAMMTVNMTALTVLTRRFLPQILERRGRIMNVSSMAGFLPGPYMAVYYATKAYVLSFSEALAEELAGSGVTVTALCPGMTRSGFQDRAGMRGSKLVNTRFMASSEFVAQSGYRAMMAGQRVCIPGAMNKIAIQAIRFFPRRWISSMVKRISAAKAP